METSDIKGSKLLEVEPDKGELKDQEVTVEVVPQTVTEIIYLQDSDLTCYTPEEDPDEVRTETYEIGTVDMTDLSSKSLVLDATQSFVLLSPGTDFINANAVFFNNALETEENDDQKAGIGEFICSLCNFKCRSLSSLTSHRSIHNDQFLKCSYNCKVCGKQFDKAQTLSFHFRTMHEKPKFICYICNYSCRNEVALLHHSRKHDSNRFACNMCTAVYDTYDRLVNHKRTHATTLLYACNICNAEFSSTTEVSCHIRTEHPKNRSPLIEKVECASYFTLCNQLPCLNVVNDQEGKGLTVTVEAPEDSGSSDSSNNISKKRRTR